MHVDERTDIEIKRKATLLAAWLKFLGRFVDLDRSLFCSFNFATPHSARVALDYCNKFIRRLGAEGAHYAQSIIFLDRGREFDRLHVHAFISGFEPLTPKEVERLWHRGMARVESARGPGAQRYLAAKAIEGNGFDAVINNRTVIQDSLLHVLADGRPRTFLEIALSLRPNSPELDSLYKLPGPVISKNLGRLIHSGQVKVDRGDDGRRRWAIRHPDWPGLAHVCPRLPLS